MRPYRDVSGCAWSGKSGLLGKGDTQCDVRLCNLELKWLKCSCQLKQENDRGTPVECDKLMSFAVTLTTAGRLSHRRTAPGEAGHASVNHLSDVGLQPVFSPGLELIFQMGIIFWGVANTLNSRVLESLCSHPFIPGRNESSVTLPCSARWISYQSLPAWLP